MNDEIKTAIAIFDQYFKRYKNEYLDDELDFIPMVKDIINGAISVSEQPDKVRNVIISHIEKCYISNWDENDKVVAQKTFVKLMK
jgi:hypothetical protein